MPPAFNMKHPNVHLTTPETFTVDNYHLLCDQIAGTDKDLKSIIQTCGYPPLWQRENSFETLVHIILEQQVSLASALATLHQLKERTAGISPQSILRLNDAELRACFVSKQKAGYIRGLALEIAEGALDLTGLSKMHNEAIRARLIHLKGIGNWTIDIYLMMCLQRIDIFPVGDLAAVKALTRLKNPGSLADKAFANSIAESWKPYRTIATMLLWHYYLSGNKKTAIIP